MKSFHKPHQRGATAIEYALIAGLIALAVVPAMNKMNNGSNGMYGGIANQVGAALTPSR